MAYQPKSYRKFVATAATATLVASVVTPALAAPISGAATFTDVPAKYQEGVNYLVDNKITLGLTPETFGTNETITRVDAAVMIGKALEIDVANAPDSGFVDVPNRAKAYVDALKAAGIINGVSATELGSAQEITRGQMALIIAKAYKLTGDASKNPFTDVSSRYADAVAALVDNKITSGTSATSFGTNAAIKRGDFATFLFKVETQQVVAPAVESVTAINATTLKVNFDKAAEAVTKEDFAVKAKADGSAVAVSSVVLSEDKKSATLTTSALAAGTTFTVSYKGATAKEVTTVALPAVESVTAINASQVVVKFNKAVDTESAETEGNFSVAGTAPSLATVQEDGKSVLLTLSSSYAEAKTVAVQVEGVKLANSQDKFPLFAGTVTINDKTAAEISGVKGTTNGDVLKAVTVSYSEPVKAGAAIKVNGVKVAVTAAGETQTITGLNLDSSKEHTVEIVNLTDGANNVSPVASFKFTATKDVTAPAVQSITGLNDNQFLVEFTEKVDAATVETADLAVVKASSFASVTVTDVKPQVGDATGTKFVVTTNLAKGDYATVNSIALNIAIRDKAFKDLPGNESAASINSVTLTKDAVAPTLSSTVFEKDNNGEVTKVTLKFDEEVALASGMDYSDLEVVQDNGVLQSGFFTASKVVGNNVELTVKSGVKAGKFSVSLPAGFVEDKSINTNKSVAVSSIVDFGQGETATTFTVTKAEVKNPNVVTVTFPVKVTGGAFDGSATSVDRYTLNGKPLPANTKITLDGVQTVATITLPAGSISSTDVAAVFQVSGVKALTGETSKLFTETLTVTDNVAPTLTSAQVLADGQTFVLTYDENVTVGTDLGSEFKIVVDGKEQILADKDLVKVSASGKQVVAKVTATVETAPAVQASATVTGTAASKAVATTPVNPTAGGTFAVAAKNVTGDFDKDPNTVDTTELHIFVDNVDKGVVPATIVIDNVTLTLTGLVDGDTFTLTTVAAKAATTAPVSFDTTKVIAVETVTVTDAIKGDFDIEDAEGNNQKGAIRLTTTR